MEGWLTLDAARKLFSASGKDYDALKAAAVRRDFRPVASAPRPRSPSTTRCAMSPRRTSRAPARLRPSSATNTHLHRALDHLGRDPPARRPDFNGAADNAAGCAVLLELAGPTPRCRRPAPERSILFSPSRRGEGLLGSRYYATVPLYPLIKTLANST